MRKFVLSEFPERADVAELVDAQVSEACGLKLVMVRFHSSAPIFAKEKGQINLSFFFFPTLDFRKCGSVSARSPLTVKRVGKINLNIMREEFINSITENQATFGLNLPEQKIARLADYYEFVQKHNELLHLVAPSSASEFAVRHVLESLTLLEYLPKKTRFVDVGTGAGLPSIPCLIVREDLRGTLIESKAKKTVFLESAAAELEISSRVQIINKQFEEAQDVRFDFVTCRALDKFAEKLPRLLKWSNGAKLLFFGGNNLAEALEKQKIKFTRKLMPLSEQRFLFVERKSGIK